ncbi:hypothetical protein OUZ56_014976 [Daphnia magna]|uniref:Uncharacterized protein n=1 Tax=Daphnia magna TaxID=35525 RepID=A0ABR0ALH2_9CRUS|nr:hypothetical protein OUZ56_014976 [Daphnia magna]
MHKTGESRDAPTFKRRRGAARIGQASAPPQLLAGQYVHTGSDMSVVDMYMDGVRLFVIVVHCHQEIAMLMDKQLDINYAANCDGL